MTTEEKINWLHTLEVPPRVKQAFIDEYSQPLGVSSSASLYARMRRIFPMYSMRTIYEKFVRPIINKANSDFVPDDYFFIFGPPNPESGRAGLHHWFYSKLEDHHAATVARNRSGLRGVFRKPWDKIKEVLTQLTGNSIFLPLLPFKKAMKKGLSDLGVNYENNIISISTKFWKYVVRKKSVPKSDGFAVTAATGAALWSAIVGAILTWFSKNKGKIEKGLGNASEKALNTLAQKGIDSITQRAIDKEQSELNRLPNVENLTPDDIEDVRGGKNNFNSIFLIVIILVVGNFLRK